MALTKIKADGLTADLIDETKLADNSIDSEHYNDGSIDNAHLADDAVGVAELSATGTASSSTFLRGDNSWAAVTSTTINNQGDNRVITGDASANTLNAESNVVIDSSGNLGIGTTSPDSLLHVYGATTGYAKIETGDGSTNPIIMHKNPDRTWHAGLRGDTSDSYVIRDATATANRLAIDSSGNVSIIGGNLVMSTSGKGIDFSATSDATGQSSELLDDYEEGTWTPHVDGWDTYSPYSGADYNYNRYVKIGQVVHIGWKLYIQNLTTVSSDAHIRITGLPFAHQTYAAGAIGHIRFDIPEYGMSGYPIVYLGGGGTTLYMYKHVNGGNNLVAMNAAANRSNVWTMGSATYLSA